MSETVLPITGGCLCGAVRYEANEPPFNAGYCHCNICKKSRGGIFAVGASFLRESVRFTKGSPKIFISVGRRKQGFLVHYPR